MHFFSVFSLAHRLRDNQVPMFEKFLYVCGVIGILVLRIPLLLMMPILYTVTFTVLKQHLELEAKRAAVTLVVYHVPLDILGVTLLGGLFIGFVYLFMLFFKTSSYRLIEDITCLAFPTLIRIISISVGLFALYMLIMGLYFGPKLCALSGKIGGNSWIVHLMRMMKKLNLFKSVIGGAKKYYLAHRLFEQMSQVSIISYYIAVASAYCNLIWFIHVLRKNLRYIYTTNSER